MLGKAITDQQVQLYTGSRTDRSTQSCAAAKAGVCKRSASRYEKGHGKQGLPFENEPRDLCLFTMGVDTAYRANELMSQTVGQVEHLEAGDRLEVF